MTPALPPSAQRVQDALTLAGLSLEVIELPASTRTAVEAAQAIGCQVGQIVKSLVFKTTNSGKALLVLASGENRVNVQRLQEVCGESLSKADADFVRQQTGYAIGGVPPLGHTQPLRTFIDEDLLRYDEIWAAAGTPHAVFRLKPEHLQRLTAGQVMCIK